MNILDLGCGANKRPGAFGVDWADGPQVDLVHDLDRFPYPIDDNSFDHVVASHIVEHLIDVPGFFREIHRICTPGALVEVVTPHFSNRSAYADPTHHHAFSVRFLDFFCGSSPRPLDFFHKAAHYMLEHRFEFTPFDTPTPFAMQSLRLSFSKLFTWIGVAAIANNALDLYEFYFAFVLPARDIFAELKVVKEG